MARIYLPPQGRRLALAGLPAVLAMVLGALLTGALMLGLMFAGLVMVLVVGVRMLLKSALGTLGGEVQPRLRRRPAERAGNNGDRHTLDMQRNGDGSWHHDR